MSQETLSIFTHRTTSLVIALILMSGFSPEVVAASPLAKEAEKPKSEASEVETPAIAPPAKDGNPAVVPGETKPAPAGSTDPATDPAIDPDDAAAIERAEAGAAAVAKPVSAEPIQIYGWREHILVNGVEEKLTAKLDTGAFTSSIHAEEKELFERDGKKWVRFIVTDPTVEKPVRTRIEAPLVRIAKIKEPGSKSVAREVVRLGFQIGDRTIRGEFTLNNRGNMLTPVLIGRTLLKNLGMVDPGRTYLAEQKVFR